MDMRSKPRSNGHALLYGADGSGDVKAMADLLSEFGVAFEFRSVSTDSAAKREWEDLDGEQLPVLKLDSHRIVRGLDRIRLQQFVGWVGC